VHAQKVEKDMAIAHCPREYEVLASYSAGSGCEICNLQKTEELIVRPVSDLFLATTAFNILKMSL